MPLRDYQRGSLPTRSKRGLPLPIAVVAALLALLLGGGIWLYVKSQAVAIATDPTSLCPIGRQPSQVVVILLDVSDQFSEPQRLQIQNDLARVRDSIPRFGLVEVYMVEGVGRPVAEPVIHLCNPGTGSDLSRIYQNPDLARRKWEAFETRLAAAIDHHMAAPELPTSPIFEAIQATALRTFGRPEYDGVPKRLVMVSDLIQNVPGELSMYEGVPPFDSFRMTPYFSRVRADLQGIGVVIYYLARAEVSIQGRGHIAFWEGYFEAQGAAIESVEKVYGDK